MRLLSSKRGNIIDFIMSPLFATIFASIVLVSLMLMIRGIKDDVIYEKRFLATDLALFADSVLSVRDNVDIIFYPERRDNDGKGFDGNISFGFKKNAVEVLDSSDDQNKGLAYFAPRKNIVMPETEFKFDKKVLVVPRISKTGNSIVLQDANKDPVPVNIHKIACSGKVSFSKLVVDPGHGFARDNPQFSDPGITVGDKRESLLTNDIALSIETEFEHAFPKGFLSFTRRPGKEEKDQKEYEFAISPEKRKELALSGDAIISLHIGSHPKDFPLKIFYNFESKNSYVLACHIANALSDKLIANNIALSGVSILPFSSKTVESHHHNLNLLPKDKLGILIEFGSMQKYDLLDVGSTKYYFATAIKEGIQNALQ